LTEQRRKLLIVEDDPGLQSQLKWCFTDYEVIVAEDREGALAQLRRHEPPVVLQDLGLPPDAEGVSEGFAAVEQTLALLPATKVIVVTGHGDQENAVRAVGLGAYDFYQKPVDTTTLHLIVDRAYQIHELERRNQELLQQQGASSPLDGIVAASEQMLQVCRMIEKVAPTGATTLLLGESGTGKEVLARAVHSLSPRIGKGFVAINCAAIPENLLESELFGYERGAYTGAVKQTPGKIENADGGTLFLDEIGDMPLSLQAKLLRFLQERVVERVGGREEIPVDVRVVCATNQDLDVAIREGRFRQDLYYRISEITIRIPPLRERDGGCRIILARTLLERYAAQHRRQFRGFSSDAQNAIENYRWPGNVREMENKIKGAVIMAEGRYVTAADLERLTKQFGLDRPVIVRFEVEVDERWRLVLREHGAHDALVHELEEGAPFDAALLREHGDLGERLGHDSEQHVVRDLDDARQFALADVGDAFAERFEVGERAVVGRPRPRGCEAQATGLDDLAVPAHGGSEERGSDGLCAGTHDGGGVGVHRRGVDEDGGSLAGNAEQTVWSGGDGEQRLGVGDHGEDDVEAGKFRGGVDDLGPVLRQGFRLRTGAVVDGHVEAGLQQPCSHGEAHVARADEPQAFVRLSLWLAHCRSTPFAPSGAPRSRSGCGKAVWWSDRARLQSFYFGSRREVASWWWLDDCTADRRCQREQQRVTIPSLP